MDSFANYLNRILEERGYKSYQQKADRTGIGYDNLRKALIGERILGDQLIIKAGRKLGLPDKEIARLLVLAANENGYEKGAELWARILEGADSIFDSDDPESRRHRVVPAWGNIRTLPGDTLSNNTATAFGEMIVSPDEANSGCFAIVVQDDSMSPELTNGEVALFQPVGPGTSVETGEIVVAAVQVGESADWIIRRIEAGSNGTVKLHAETVEPVEFRPKQDQNIKVRGILIRSEKRHRKKKITL